jgi:hypothetical protein
VNSDGTLSQNEIKKGLAAVKEATGLVQSAKQIFRGADADGDQSVDADKFYAYMAEQTTQVRTEEDLLGRFGLDPQTKTQPKPEAAAPKKGKPAGKKKKGGHGPKAPTQAAQKDKTIQMKETIAKKDAEVAKKDAEVAQLRAEIARLRFETPATGQPTQEPALAKPAPKKEPLPRARQRPASPQPAERTTPPEAGSPLKRPPSLHVMAQRASALSPGRTRSFGGNQGLDPLGVLARPLRETLYKLSLGNDYDCRFCVDSPDTRTLRTPGGSPAREATS